MENRMRTVINILMAFLFVVSEKRSRSRRSRSCYFSTFLTLVENPGIDPGTSRIVVVLCIKTINQLVFGMLGVVTCGMTAVATPSKIYFFKNLLE